MNKSNQWLSIQSDSFKRFFSKTEPHPEFSLERLLKAYGSMDLYDGHTLIIKDYSLDEPKKGAQECIDTNSTYCRSLWFHFCLKGPLTENADCRFSVCMAAVPAPTSTSEFILSSSNQGTANRYTVTMQLAQSPGLYYEEKGKEDEAFLRICRLSPAFGKKMIFRSREGRKGKREPIRWFWMDGLGLSLEEFQKLIAGTTLTVEDWDLLKQLYDYLDHAHQLSDEQKQSIGMLDPSNMTRLQQLRDLFVNYITSFDMSRLGKLQMKQVLGPVTDEANTRLNESEIGSVLKAFIENKLPETDSRSLQNRKVKLIGDFLFEKMAGALRELERKVQENWVLYFWAPWSKKRSRMEKMGESEDEGGCQELPDRHRLIPPHFFSDSLHRFFTSELLQLLDDANPLAEISQKRRLTLRGPGGVPENALFLPMRDVHPMDFGRLCPVETPQGADLGLNLYLARDARVNELGLIEARYLDRRSNEEVFLDPYEEALQAGAIAAEPLDPGVDDVYVKTHDAELVVASPGAVTHGTPSPDSFLGYAASLIPFFQHNDANRALMGANMMKQAVSLTNPEAPLVKTGFEAEIAAKCGDLNPSADAFVADGELCLGRNLLVGYLPWDLLNYEDGIVISEALARQDRLTHLEVEELVFDESFATTDEITRDNPHVSEQSLALLDDNGVILEGTKVQPGTLLISRIRPETLAERSGMPQQEHLATELAIRIFGRRSAGSTRDTSLYAADGVFGTVKSMRWVTEGLPWGVSRRVHLTLERRVPCRVGDKLTGRHGNKGVVSRILREHEMPYFKSTVPRCQDPACKVKIAHTHLEILLNPLTITGRMNLGQLYETALGWIACHNQTPSPFTVPPFCKDWTWKKIDSLLKQKGLSHQQQLYFFREEDEQETPLKSPVTVGYQYFLKLKHLAEDKLKARDHFAHSPTTGQPTVPTAKDPWKRKEVNRRTPQRLGEMEVWALEGHSAWHILDELLFLKSDAEPIRLALIDQLRGLASERKKAFRQLTDQAKGQGWHSTEDGMMLRVTCPSLDHEKLSELGRRLGCRVRLQDTPNPLLFVLRPDDEKLQQKAAEARQPVSHVRTETCNGLKNQVRRKAWPILRDRSGLVFDVACPARDQASLLAVAEKQCYVAESSVAETFLLEFDPIETHEREHRSFKAFVHYGRALGLEIEGVGQNGLSVPLVGIGEAVWPDLTAISIRLATDAERKHWADGKVIRRLGTEKSGLWSNTIFGSSYEFEDHELLSDATGLIELAVPVDNPLFRKSIELLLNQNGYWFEDIREEFAKIASEHGFAADWSDTERVEFWKTAHEGRSMLQTIDDLLDWLSDLIGDNSNGGKRRALAADLESRLRIYDQFNFREVLSSLSPHYLDAKGLFQHFQFLAENLQKIENRLRYGLQEGASTRTDLALIELISLMREKGYHPTMFFIQNLLVLPKNLRFEKTDWKKDPDPRYENDLNHLYKAIVRQNNKILDYYETGTPGLICHKEEEELRKIVYALLVNDKIHGILDEPFLWPKSERSFVSVLTHVSGATTGKDGIFRKHLLGKRVDYAGRGVIVPDPELGLDEAGLPFKMGKVLFRDHLINRILKDRLVPDKETIDYDDGTSIDRSLTTGMRLVRAKDFLDDEENGQTIQMLIQELGREHYVLLNRAPSLHRLSILAFRPRFYQDDQGDVLRLNPYVCAPFNADFDGDTMAVHLPMLPGSRSDAERMLPSQVLRSPGHGKLFISCKGDLALARYLGTVGSDPSKAQGAEDLYRLFDAWARQGSDALISNLSVLTADFRRTLNESGFSLGIPDLILDPSIRTTVANYERRYWAASFSDPEERMGFWETKTQEVRDYVSNLPAGGPLATLQKSKAAKMELTQLCGMRGIMLRPGGGYVSYPVCSNIVDGMSPLEYFVSCHGSRHGLSDKGLMTAPAGDLTNVIVQAVQAESIVEEDCGTERGFWLSAFSDPDGGSIPLQERITGRYLASPIDLGDGVTIGRDELITAELAEKISQAGFQEVKIRSPLTCQGVNTKTKAWENFVRQAEGKLLSSRLAGDHFPGNPAVEEFRLWYSGTGRSLTEQNPPSDPVALDEAVLLSMARMGIRVVEVHDPETGVARMIPVPAVSGVCKKCYGLDLASGELPEIGYPAGVIAAQSIGEPGTQLTLRTFHTGGTAGQEISQGLTTVRKAFYSGRTEKQPLRSGIDGDATIVSSSNGLIWLEVKGKDSRGRDGAQRLLIMEHNPISGWNADMERSLAVGNLGYEETHLKDGTRSFSPHGLGAEFKTVNKGEAFPVSIGQRLYLSRHRGQTTTVALKEVCRRYGPMAAAEYLHHVLQKIYNSNNKVADHHFELVLRAMLRELKVTEPGESNFAVGETLSLLHYLSLSRKPAVSIRTLLDAASDAPGFLGRLAFRRVAHHLATASLAKETDWLVGLKEKIIAGQVRKG